jgi:hypothetical protein
VTTADREWLLRDSMRLEDAAPDVTKPLWIVSRGQGRDEEILILEALTAPGSRAIGEALDLISPDDGDLRVAGPIARVVWPRGLWYRWLSEQDLADFLGTYLPPELPKP